MVCGYSLSPAVWVAFLLPRLEAAPSSAHLLLLGGLARGALGCPVLGGLGGGRGRGLGDQLGRLAQTLAADSVCYR